jgi:hypothetical protein
MNKRSDFPLHEDIFNAGCLAIGINLPAFEKIGI